MRRKLLPFFAIGTVILGATFVLHTLGVTGTGKRMEFQTVTPTSGSRRSSSGYYVVQNVDEWVEVFGQQTPPEVDFSRDTVIAVFMGSFRTGGYSIRVKEIIDTGLLVVVKVEKSYPGRGCVLPQVITSPYHVVKVDKIGKYVVFDTLSRTRECS